MSLGHARAVADAVLVEGYALYPYRASAQKNRYRWAFGVLAPRAWSEAGGGDPWWLESQLLVAGAGPAGRLSGQLRFFQIERRTIEASGEANGGRFTPVDSLEVDGQLLVAWDEGRVRTIELAFELEAARTGVRIPFAIDGRDELEHVPGGRIVRERVPLCGIIAVFAEPVAAGSPLLRVAIRVENVTAWRKLGAPRDQAITAAFASTHLLLEASDASFVSLLDPPAWAGEAAAGCHNVGTYPVLAGVPGQHDVVLSAPIILYDHPQLAPESPHDLFDATEIDEILTLRTMTLTDAEKREARATDPRAAAILDHVDALPPEWLARLHGAARDVRASDDQMMPRSCAFAPGCQVRLRANGRRTDAQDLLYDGMLATVAEVRPDIDGTIYLAVTIDDDPAAELHDWYGRYHHYRTDEVELVSPAPAVAHARPSREDG
jgi:hypothetical protein